MVRPWRVGLALAAGFVVAGAVSADYGHGRRFWYPYVVTVFGARTHDQVVKDLRTRRLEGVRRLARDAGVAFPPRRLRLVGLKEEKTLEAWAQKGDGWTRLASYPVLAASGGAGPKLREGDLQVPEGVYRLTAFNPNSSYHLSIRVDYPSAEDRAIAQREGRPNPGSDIFIHGKAVSIGCLAIGDEAIEELYLLLAETGLANADIVISPSLRPETPKDAPSWVVDRYSELRRELNRTRGARRTEP